MKTSQHTAEQIIRILEQAERGTQTIGILCREHGITRRLLPLAQSVRGHGTP